MNKSERLQDMLRYLNSREFFNLQDLMDKYQISKSTALRDIRSLEQLGMPIYSEYGRHGRYGILQNRLLSPVIFTLDEVYALYFAMLTLQSYQSTPFHMHVNQLQEKFEKCLSQEQIKKIRSMKKVLQLESNQHHHVSFYLEQILKSILHENICTIQYARNKGSKSYRVQFFKISAKFGQWYATGIEVNTNQQRVFRCDKVTSMQVEAEESRFSLDELVSRSLELYQSVCHIRFEVEIEEQAKDIFYKESYPSMKLDIGEQTVITGFYNPGEESFIAEYFMRYGSHVVAVKPESLRTMIQSKVEQLLQHYQTSIT
ncbi:YafY family protein [Paenibacillus sp. chi10]|uniref:YafY family protein n=1 Tax=Paenibacillus suaedae TaxID=3077233 RepID=A0AAJ2JYE3_9BACL|nr:YafY family protein [Paenibacillus sp. chi10]MDT8978761.1 YafY family protein [Paenibacillus sp. chi10]